MMVAVMTGKSYRPAADVQEADVAMITMFIESVRMQLVGLWFIPA